MVAIITGPIISLFIMWTSLGLLRGIASAATINTTAITTTAATTIGITVQTGPVPFYPIQPVTNLNLCIQPETEASRARVVLRPCDSPPSISQIWGVYQLPDSFAPGKILYRFAQQSGLRCMAIGPDDYLVMGTCDLYSEWESPVTVPNIMSLIFSNELCLLGEGSFLKVVRCDAGSILQKWTIGVRYG